MHLLIQKTLEKCSAVPQMCFEGRTGSLHKMSPLPPPNTRQSAPKQLHLRETEDSMWQGADFSYRTYRGQEKQKRGTYALEDTR